MELDGASREAEEGATRQQRLERLGGSPYVFHRRGMVPLSLAGLTANFQSP